MEYSNSNSLLLYGASGHAKVIIDSYLSSGGVVRGLFDDNPKVKELMSYKVYHNYSSDIYSSSSVVISIGDNRIRKKVANFIKHNFATVVHPSSVVSNTAVINRGTVVFANAVIQPSSIIGEHCIINTKASLDHDCIVGDFVHLGPGSTVCGGVSIGEGTFIGAGAVITPNLTIGKWSVLGAGSVALKDIPDNEVWVGNPARKLRNIE